MQFYYIMFILGPEKDGNKKETVEKNIRLHFSSIIRERANHQVDY